MKSLYDTDHRYTSDARELSEATIAALKHIFAKYVEQGYSPREIAHLMQADVADLEVSSVLNLDRLETD